MLNKDKKRICKLEETWENILAEVLREQQQVMKQNRKSEQELEQKSNLKKPENYPIKHKEESRGKWNAVFKSLKENYWQHKIWYVVKCPLA